MFFSACVQNVKLANELESNKMAYEMSAVLCVCVCHRQASHDGFTK